MHKTNIFLSSIYWTIQPFLQKYSSLFQVIAFLEGHRPYQQCSDKHIPNKDFSKMQGWVLVGTKR